MDINYIYELGKMVGLGVSLSGAVYAISTLIRRLLSTADDTRTFLNTTVPQFSQALDSVCRNVEKLTTNHAYHVEQATTRIAESMDVLARNMEQLTRDFHDHELSDAQVQTTILERLNDLKDKK